MDVDAYENWAPFELALADVLNAGVSEDDVVARVRRFAEYEREVAADRATDERPAESAELPRGWYYLHANGELIYKDAAYTVVSDLLESDLVVAFWPIDDPSNPAHSEWAWTLLVEALAGDAEPTRVRELADNWGCDAESAQEYAARFGVAVTPVGDGVHWIAAVGERRGAGHSALEALADLAKGLGYRPRGLGFGFLVKAASAGRSPE